MISIIFYLKVIFFVFYIHPFHSLLNNTSSLTISQKFKNIINVVRKRETMNHFTKIFSLMV